MSSQILLLSFQGRRSGQRYTIPVGYMRDGDNLTIFTDHRWWKNLEQQAIVTMHLQGQARRGTSEVIHEKGRTETELARYLRRVPKAARAYGVQVDKEGNIKAENIHEAAQRFTMICIQLHA